MSEEWEAACHQWQRMFHDMVRQRNAEKARLAEAVKVLEHSYSRFESLAAFFETIGATQDWGKCSADAAMTAEAIRSARGASSSGGSSHDPAPLPPSQCDTPYETQHRGNE